MKRFRYFKEKIIFCLMFILLLQLCLVPAVSQAANGQGKIQVQLNDIGTVREGVVVECYQVGELKDGGEYLLLDEYKQTGVDFSDIKTAEDHRNAAEILEKAVKPSGLSHSDKTAADGTVSFENLDDGIYLIKQGAKAEYGIMQAFFVYVPYTGTDGAFVYDVKANAKGENMESTAQTTQTTETSGSSTEEQKTKTGDSMPVAALSAVLIAVLAIMLILIKQNRNKAKGK